MKKVTQHQLYIMMMDIDDSLVILNSVKEVIKELPEEVSFSEDEFKAKCVMHSMKKSRGSLNPQKANTVINNLLS